MNNPSSTSIPLLSPTTPKTVASGQAVLEEASTSSISSSTSTSAASTSSISTTTATHSLTTHLSRHPTNHTPQTPSSFPKETPLPSSSTDSDNANTSNANSTANSAIFPKPAIVVISAVLGVLLFAFIAAMILVLHRRRRTRKFIPPPTPQEASKDVPFLVSRTPQPAPLQQRIPQPRFQNVPPLPVLATTELGRKDTLESAVDAVQPISGSEIMSMQANVHRNLSINRMSTTSNRGTSLGEFRYLPTVRKNGVTFAEFPDQDGKDVEPLDS
ncbi:hypothetical protein HDU97_005114 [Phlyctochytrium planicorne]|nr:hypothetical protein HDU97_005114 [Phlyctochytrium planicorne]